MADLREYSVNVKFAGNLAVGNIVYTAEIPAFGAAAIVHGGSRDQAVSNAQGMLANLEYAYQQQGLSLPPGDSEG
ncbi:MAG TPA: hypothetical protein V6C65_40290 [Allocoleopsis sp.]